MWITGTATDPADMLAKIVTHMTANGWTLLGASTSTEKYLSSPALGVATQFVGLKLVTDGVNNKYHLELQAYTGVIAGAGFTAHPGAQANANYRTLLLLWNNSMPYWAQVTARRLSIMVKVGGSTYHSGYLGMPLPMALPSQWPLPLVIGGSGCGYQSTTPGHSDTGDAVSNFWSTQLNRPQLWLRDAAGIWQKFERQNFQNGSWYEGTYPYTARNNKCRNFRPITSTSKYPIIPIEFGLFSTTSRYGWFDGLHHVSGVNLSPETTITGDDSKTYIVFPNVYRTDAANWVAMTQE